MMTVEAFFTIANGIFSVLIWILSAAAVIGFLIVLFRLLRRFTIDKLVYKRQFAEECVYEGDTVELIESLWNPTPFPIFLVDVESYFYNGLAIGIREAAKGEMRYFVSRFHVMPFEMVEKRIEVTCKKRGYYKLTSASVFRCGEERSMESEAELYVYPKAADFCEAFPGAFGLGTERSRNRLIPDPFSVNGIREYQQGDPFRTINFKASARLSAGGHPHFAVNRYEYCSNNKYYIYQNFHLPKSGSLHFDQYELLMEDGLRMAATLLVRAINAGGMCAFSANCGTIDGHKKVSFPLKGGELHKKEILKEMARTRAMDGVSFASILSADRMKGIYQSDIFLITAYVDDAISQQITGLEAMGNHVKVLLLEGGAS